MNSRRPDLPFLEAARLRSVHLNGAASAPLHRLRGRLAAASPSRKMSCVGNVSRVTATRVANPSITEGQFIVVKGVSISQGTVKYALLIFEGEDEEASRAVWCTRATGRPRETKLNCSRNWGCIFPKQYRCISKSIHVYLNEYLNTSRICMYRLSSEYRCWGRTSPIWYSLVFCNVFSCG